MSVLAWVGLVVALVGSAAFGALLVHGWMSKRMSDAVRAAETEGRKRVCDLRSDNDRVVASLVGRNEQLATMNDMLRDANNTLRERVAQTSWAVHSWGPKRERGQA